MKLKHLFGVLAMATATLGAAGTTQAQAPTTIIYDSNTGADFNGAKTVLAAGFTDESASAQVSITASSLQIAGDGSGYLHSFAIREGEPHTSQRVVAYTTGAQMTPGSYKLLLLRYTAGRAYEAAISNGQLLIYSLASGGLTQVGATGSYTVTAGHAYHGDFYAVPHAGGGTDLSLTLTDDTVPTVFTPVTVSADTVGPQGAGGAGVGGSNSTQNFSRVITYSSDVGAIATAYTAALSAASGVPGSPVTVTYTGNGTTAAIITPSVSGVTGTFGAATVTLNGTSPVTDTFTPTSAGTATLSSTNSGTLTNPGGLTYTVAAAPTKQADFIGTSLTYGTNATSGQGGVTGTVYPAVTLGYLGSTWAGVNKGVSGQLATTMITNEATQIGAVYSGTYSTHVCVLEPLANQIGQATDSAATLEGYVKTLAAYARAQGFRVVVKTTTHAFYGGPGLAVGTYPRQGAAFDPVADAVNTLMRADWRSYADGFADIAADSRLADETNTTYYSADQVHRTDAGYAIDAQYTVAAIQQAISGGVAPGITIRRRIN